MKITYDARTDTPASLLRDGAPVAESDEDKGSTATACMDSCGSRLMPSLQSSPVTASAL
jgi:hypothetical protein